jgi:anti-sigma factor RsiW
MSSREPVHPEELLLLDYVIGQLPDETRDQIKRHVAGCRACRRTIDDLILTVDELDRLPTMAIPHDSPAELAAARARPR